VCGGGEDFAECDVFPAVYLMMLLQHVRMCALVHIMMPADMQGIISLSASSSAEDDGVRCVSMRACVHASASAHVYVCVFCVRVCVECVFAFVCVHVRMLLHASWVSQRCELFDSRLSLLASA
jgi:hypothetical protein